MKIYLTLLFCLCIVPHAEAQNPITFGSTEVTPAVTPEPSTFDEISLADQGYVEIVKQYKSSDQFKNLRRLQQHRRLRFMERNKETIGDWAVENGVAMGAIAMPMPVQDDAGNWVAPPQEAIDWSSILAILLPILLDWLSGLFAISDGVSFYNVA